VTDLEYLEGLRAGALAERARERVRYDNLLRELRAVRALLDRRELYLKDVERQIEEMNRE